MSCFLCEDNMQQIQDKEKNNKINEEIMLDRRRRERELKILLLGREDSGKSAVAKQIWLIHSGGFSESWLLNHKTLIYSFLFSSICTLAQGVGSTDLKLSFQNEEAALRLHRAVRESSEFQEKNTLTEQNLKDLKTMWEDRAIQIALQKFQFGFSDSVSYYFNSLDRIGAAGYIPTHEDVIYLKQTKSSITENFVMVDDICFKLIEIGEQKGSGRKWMHLFQDVTAVYFFASLGYEADKEEEQEKKEKEGKEISGRMKESIKSFGELCQIDYLRDTPFVLFLTRKDLLVEKMEREGKGITECEEAIKEVQRKFNEVAETATREAHAHVIGSVDSLVIEHLFSITKDIVLREILRDDGIK